MRVKISGTFGCSSVSRCIKGGIDTIECLSKHVCINNPQSRGIIIFLCIYYIVISDTLGDSFLDVLFLFLAVILLELHEKPRRNKDWVAEKT